MKASLRRRATGDPRTDNILKVVGGVVGFVVLLVVIRKVATLTAR